MRMAHDDPSRIDVLWPADLADPLFTWLARLPD
jgi:hypothetical protein